jgi:mRNA interferase RelE/StbE
VNNSKYSFSFEESAQRQFNKLDGSVRKRIQAYINKHVERSEDPRRVGEPLGGERSGLWRYRIGKYRLVCHIADEKLTILAVKVDHRAKVYK